MQETEEKMKNKIKDTNKIFKIQRNNKRYKENIKETKKT